MRSQLGFHPLRVLDGSFDDSYEIGFWEFGREAGGVGGREDESCVLGLEKEGYELRSNMAGCCGDEDGLHREEMYRFLLPEILKG